MKNLTKLCVLVLGASFLLNSCGSVKIEKRHFNKGYYVDLGMKHSTKNNKVSTQEKQQKEVVIEEETILLTEASNVSKNEETSVVSSVVTSDNSQNNTSGFGQKSFANSVKDLEVNNEGEKSKFNTIKTKIASNRIVSKINKLQKKSMKIPAADDAHAHSLLWIIIVVIIILWLLGFLYGSLGSLIHLLLLIALILLILWLLRVL